MKKALVAATVIGFIAEFEINDIELLQTHGYEVHYAAKCDAFDNEEKINILDSMGVIKHDVSFNRNPFNKNNILAYKTLRNIINNEHFDVIHCHTPVGGILTRLAARSTRKKGTKIIYTAHGFHFYKGAPLKNWLLYYPVEKLCSYFTDVLITINKEDYLLAQKKMKAKKTYYIPGVGIDLQKLSNTSIDREKKRNELGVPDNAVLLLSVGELNENKNHETVIRALSMLEDTKVFYIIAGIGSKKEQLENIISELGLEKNIYLIGYRNDVNELLAAADIFVFPSFREGLSVALMEAMACGLPIACSRIRGNVDLLDEDKGGIGFDPKSVKDTANVLNALLKSNLDIMGKYNSEKIKAFDVNCTKNKMKEIYESLD